jgi:hypothetical protein
METFGLHSTLNDCIHHIRFDQRRDHEMNGEKADQVYTFAMPTDVQYTPDDDTKKNEYLSMSNDVEAIKSSFELMK